VTLTEGPRNAVVDGVRVQLDGDAEVGRRSDLHYTLSDAATGRPVDDLRPYLAAAGHIVVMRADGQTFAHEHAEFPTAGTYQLWAQFRLADGDVITVPFTVQAS
jgi:Cu+-exporting ATPase